MGFAQEMKEFVSAAQAGWKMMTPTPADVKQRELNAALEQEKYRREQFDRPSRLGGASPVGRGEGAESGDVAGAATDPVAEDLKPHEKALLNAISGPESAGKYNVRYTPDGGKTFDETGEHPAIPEPTKSGEKSTAAGRYQFVKSTWDRVAGDLPFTRENQDRMALKLARQDYNARTGRNLDADLSARGLTPGIMKALAPTWEGFKSGEGQSKAAKLYATSLDRYAEKPAPTTTTASADESSTAMAVAPTTTARARPSAVPVVPVVPAAATPVRTPAVPIEPAAVTIPLPPRRPTGLPQPLAPIMVDEASAIPLPEEDPYLRQGIYAAKGGLVPHYARGGLAVPESAIDTDTDEMSDEEAQKYLDTPLAYVQMGARKGLDQLQNRFGLKSGAVPEESPRAQDGARALAANAGAPNPNDVAAIMNAADPEHKLSEDQRAINGWGNMIKYYTDRGNPQAAANAGAAMLMHSKRMSQQAGAMALTALERGDFDTAAKAIQAAYNSFPNGESVRVNTAGEDGIEYEVVTPKGIRGGKVTPEELKALATGMLNGSQWFQHATQLTNMPAAKPADIAKRQQIKAIQDFEEKLPEDARGPEDLNKDLRKSWANLPSPYRREQEKKWRDLKKQDKAEGEQAAEEKFYSDPEVRDQFRSTLSEEKLAEFEKLTEKQKGTALRAFEKKRTQDFNEFKFGARMEDNAKNRDRKEALDLFKFATRYGMWQETRKQILTENEQKHADRLMQEEGRDRRQGLSIAQQNKVQENIDRRILEKRTATLDATGARLTAPEAREQRRLGAVDAREEQALTSLDERMGTGVVPDEEAGMGEVAAQRIQRGRQFEERAAPYRAQTGFERLTKGPEAKSREFDPEDYKAIRDDIVKRWSAPAEGGGKRKPLSEADQHVLTSIGSDILRTGNMTPEYAGNLTVRALDPKTPLKIMPDRSVMIGEGTNRQPVFLSSESMLRLAELRARVGAPLSAGGSAVELETAPRRTLREQIQAPAKARQEQKSAIDLATAAARQPDGSQYQAMRDQLGDWYREGMSFAEMQQALRDKYALEGTRPSIQRRGVR